MLSQLYGVYILAGCWMSRCLTGCPVDQPCSAPLFEHHIGESPVYQPDPKFLRQTSGHPLDQLARFLSSICAEHIQNAIVDNARYIYTTACTCTICTFLIVDKNGAMLWSDILSISPSKYCLKQCL